jgi:hypothetical protein
MVPWPHLAIAGRPAGPMLIVVCARPVQGIGPWPHLRVASRDDLI